MRESVYDLEDAGYIFYLHENAGIWISIRDNLTVRADVVSARAKNLSSMH